MVNLTVVSVVSALHVKPILGMLLVLSWAMGHSVSTLTSLLGNPPLPGSVQACRLTVTGQ